MESQQYSLRWNNYLRHIKGAFASLRTEEDLVDVTLCCDGHKVHAHKMLLSACSSYFRDLFKENPCQHPVIIFRDVSFEDLSALIDFMYAGEVNVEQEQLPSFLSTAELLQVQGLTNSAEKTDRRDPQREQRDDMEVPPPEVDFRSSSPTPSQGQSEDSTPATSRTSLHLNAEPVTKKRKWQTGAECPVTVMPVMPGESSLSKDHSRSSSPPLEIVAMKCEPTDYIEADPVEDSAADTLAKLRDNEELQLTSSRDLLQAETHFGSQAQTFEGKGDLMGAGPSSEGHDGFSGWAQSPKLPPAQLIPIRRPKPSAVAAVRMFGGGGLEVSEFVACKVCGRAFRDRKSCHRHMSMHLGTSTCPICYSILSRVSHLKRHMRNVHGVGVSPKSMEEQSELCILPVETRLKLKTATSKSQ